MKKDILEILVHFGAQNHQIQPCHDKTAFEIMQKEGLIVPNEQHPGYFDLTRKGNHLYDAVCTIVSIVSNVD